MNIFNYFIILVAVCLFVFQSASAQIAAATSTREIKTDLMIKNINVIDVKTGKVNHSVNVVIRQDKIYKIVKSKKSSKYESLQIVDGTGKFLIPGLWDMHTHIGANYKLFFPLLLANGVTGIREMWGNPAEIKKIRDEINSGTIDGPMIVTSGAVIDGNPPTSGNMNVAETPEQGREIVRKQKAGGAEFIKVYFNLKKDVYLAVADEAKKLDLPLAGHLPNRVSLDEAVKAGHRSFEHFYNILEFYGDQKGLDRIEETREGRFAGDNFYVRLDYGYKTFDPAKSNDAIRLLKSDNVWICPTYTVHKGFMRDFDPSYTDDKRLAFMPENLVARWTANKKKPLTEKQIQQWNSDKLWYARVLTESKKYKENGVKFLAGTDVANFFVYPGFSLHEELEIFVNEAGFSPLEALQTATINPAEFLNLENQLGTIEEGKLANLVILNKNPLENISHTKTIDAVVFSGKYKSKSDLKNIELK
jgi:imidazolonepropionase-like amidohydrolase